MNLRLHGGTETRSERTPPCKITKNILIFVAGPVKFITDMQIFARLKKFILETVQISDHIDTVAAAGNIRNNIYFRGPNVWILAFSILIASVGLNVNSTAVIIGAMLVSPLMGPIIGIGLGMGINDTDLLKQSLKNLLVMVVISILASFLFFLVSPLELANPTELEARTNPTIYDVLIALFGGFAGILEISRKEKGTVLSGVAIATALMPPLCTAGYGLAHLNLTYFFGALFLFCINGTFITLATYFSTKYMRYKEVEFENPMHARKTRRLIYALVLLIMVPSIWSAVHMIRENRLTKQISSFVAENKSLSSGYIYDYKIDYKHGGKATLFITGGSLSPMERERLLGAAEKLGIDKERLEFVQHEYSGMNNEATEKIIKGIYERNDSEITKRDLEITRLEEELETLRKAQIPYLRIYREINSQYPEIKDLYITQGAHLAADTLRQAGLVLYTPHALSERDSTNLANWLKVRLEHSCAIILHGQEGERGPEENDGGETERGPDGERERDGWLPAWENGK